MFTGLPGVLFVLPDSYVDAENKDYGGKCSAVLKFSSSYSFFCVILYSVIPKFLLLHQVEFEEFNGYFRIYVFRFQLIVEILM